MGSAIRLTGLLLLVSCGGPETRVLLNERLFVLPAMTSLGRGCTVYVLGDGGDSSAPEVGIATMGFSVRQRWNGRAVLITATTDGGVLAQKVYDEAFFRSEAVDEFVVTAPPDKAWLLKYWGAVEKNGTLECASFNDGT